MFVKKTVFTILMFFSLLVACDSPEANPFEEALILETEVTRIIAVETEVTRIVEVEVEKEVTRVVEIPVEIVVTATPEPEAETVEGEDAIARNYVYTEENNGLVFEVSRVLVASASSDLLTVNFSEAPGFEDAETVGMLYFTITNNSDETLDVYPDQGSVQVNSEQIDLIAFMFDATFGDDIGGEIFPGVTKQGGIWFVIERSNVDEITSIIYRAPGPIGDNFSDRGPDFEIVLDLSERVFEPLPEELN